MSDSTNKPKNVTDLGVTFEERLAQLGKLSKQSRSDSSTLATRQAHQYPHHDQSRSSNIVNASDKTKMSNPRAQKALDEYKQKGQSKQILMVWFMLMQAFDSKMKHFFGEEPDEHFMKFAVSLTPDSYARLEANLLERLDEDREWPPSLIRLRQLANSPTKETMYKARQRLFHHPVPKSELDRVELFIKKYKMREVKSFSERNFEAEFNRKYTQWFREVILDDMDVHMEQQAEKMQRILEVEHTTEIDQKRDEVISQGNAFNNVFGARILKAIQDKHSQPEELSNQEVEVLEQQRLATSIRKQTGEK